MCAWGGVCSRSIMRAAACGIMLWWHACDIIIIVCGIIIIITIMQRHACVKACGGNNAHVVSRFYGLLLDELGGLQSEPGLGIGMRQHVRSVTGPVHHGPHVPCHVRKRQHATCATRHAPYAMCAWGVWCHGVCHGACTHGHHVPWGGVRQHFVTKRAK
jgi:hypothetical protein